MNVPIPDAASLRRTLVSGLRAAVIGLAASAAMAGPGAHGPNGEHLDGPSPASAGVAAAPRFETQTETFELVGVLAGGELSLLIDRFETNEPVLEAAVEVESSGVRARAAFHADHGDYSVTDPELLRVLAQPGLHPIVITVIAAAGQSDLLDATLETPAQAQLHAHDHTAERARLAGIGLAAALLAGSAWWLLRRRSARRAVRAGA